MKRPLLFFCYLGLAVLGATGSVFEPASAATSTLMNYVTKPDDSYAWTTHARYRVGDSEVMELRLHSQTWRGTLWKHQLYLIKPSRLETPNQGLLIVGGGRWRDGYETEQPSQSLPDGAELFVGIAEVLGSVVAVLGQVPFQPLFDKTEDRIIAYTFDQYLSTGDSEWPLLLPMVKSAMRAIDATQEASMAEWATSLEAFTVMGGSKRGWTTWLIGAVDPRVNALVPVVIDALNMERHFPHQTEVWGSPSEKLRPYTELNLHQVLGSPEGHALREIIDPFAYRSVLLQPKLIVVATNDEYFPVDSLNLYWDALREPKYILYLPNDQHSIEDYLRLIPTLNAIHRSAAGAGPLPTVDWEYQSGESALLLCVRSEPAPESVLAWTAYSDDRDFRDDHWSSAPLTKSTETAYTIELTRPASGYAAVFGELVFGEGDAAFTLSTNLHVLASLENSGQTLPMPRFGDPCPRDL